MIQLKSNAFMRCNTCGGTIRPDEDLDVPVCEACDEAYWESLMASMPPENYGDQVCEASYEEDAFLPPEYNDYIPDLTY